MDEEVARKIVRELERRSGERFSTDLEGTWHPWLTRWIGGGERAPETPFFFDVGVVLVAEDGVRIAALVGDEIETTYLGPLIGGRYREWIAWVDSAWVLRFEFVHDDLSEPLGQSFRTEREIEPFAASPLRDLLRRWSEDSA